MGKYLAHAFRSQLDCIAELRSGNGEFDELCRHFEEVSSVLDAGNRCSTAESEELASVLVELQREIADYLASHS